MIPKATENTISSLLRDELQRLGVRVELFPRITTPAGSREPDLLCVNAGTYPVEAKFTERDLVQAIAKVQNDYLKHYRVLGIKGGFAILYPEELTQPMPVEAAESLARKLNFKLIAMFPLEDPRPFTVYEGKLQEVAETLSEHILAPPKRVEPSIEYIMKSLRESVLYILNGLRHLKGRELEVFFGGKDVFKNILQYEKGEYPVEELRSAAAYLLLNQILFYQVLARTKREVFEEIDADKLRKPEDLNNYFQKVLDVNYKTVYSYDVASLIPQEFVDQVKTMVNLVQGLSPEKVGGDLLGTIFHDLVPFGTRKNVAAFYTNVLAAELLASLSIDSPDAKVADLAVGSGGLLVAAYRRKKELLGRPVTQKDHRKFVEEDLLGVDVMPFAANVAACHLALQSPEYFTNRVNVAVWDSTCLRPGMKIPSVTEAARSYLTSFMFPKTTEKGAVSLTDKEAQEIELGKYDVIIMNPPFTRQERLPEDYKSILYNRFSEYKEYQHGQMGYHGYFVLLADRFLKKGGTLALVLPVTVLSLKSCQGLRELLINNYHVKYILTTTERAAFSENVQFREMLLVATKIRELREKNEKDRNLRCALFDLKRLPRSIREAKSIADKIRNMLAREADYDYNEITVKVVTQQELEKNIDNLFRLLPTTTLDIEEAWSEIIEKSEKLTTMKDYLTKVNGRIIRGIQVWKGDAIFAPDMFILRKKERALKDYDRWFVEREEKRSIIARNRFTGASIKVPYTTLVCGVRRISRMSRIDATDELDYVIIKPFNRIEQFLSKKIIWKHLNYWRNYVMERLCHLTIAGRFDISAPGTCLIAFFSKEEAAPSQMLWCIKGLTLEDAKILALWMNSTLGILQLMKQRKETRGAFIQLLGSALKNLYIIDPRTLSHEEREIFLRTFENIKNIHFPSITQQLDRVFPARREIDTSILKILGFPEEQINSFLNRIYAGLAYEINILKSIMEGKKKKTENV